ncbi:hypothetical protein U1Q18_047949 [Sarracenia purpurea var. burkii]
MKVEINEDDLRNWASFRGQTLSRTEKEEIGADKPHKVYSSILVKAVNGFDQADWSFFEINLCLPGA